MKYFIALFLFIPSWISLSQDLDNYHKVTIHVVDSTSYPVPNVSFDILNASRSLVKKGSSDSSGNFELYLAKGQQYQAFFPNFDKEIRYNFRVPTETRLKGYQVICRLPYDLIKEGRRKSIDKSSEETKSNVRIILQNKELEKIPEHEFSLVSSDKKFSLSCKTDQYGVFSTELLETQRYHVKTKFDNEEYDDEFTVPAGIKEYTFRLILPFTSKGVPDIPTQSSINKYLRTFTLQNINFETGSYELKSSSYPYLDTLVKELRSKPGMEIEIAGHTDDVGSLESNQVLSQNRAETIYKYLADKGIETSRMTAVGYGETAPIAPNETAEGRAQNRRIEVRVIRE